MRNSKPGNFLLNISFAFLLLISTVCSSLAQLYSPVKWNFRIHKLSDYEYEILFQGEIDKSWHLYGQNKYGKKGSVGPMPISFSFFENENYTLIGNIIQGKYIKEREPLWDFKVQYFENQATFKQKVKLTTTKMVAIKGEIKYMVGNGTKCLPLYKADFVFSVAGNTACIDHTNRSTVSFECDSNSIGQTLEMPEQYNMINDSLTKKTVDVVMPKKILKDSEIETEENTNWIFFILFGF